MATKSSTSKTKSNKTDSNPQTKTSSSQTSERSIARGSNARANSSPNAKESNTKASNNQISDVSSAKANSVREASNNTSNKNSGRGGKSLASTSARADLLRLGEDESLLREEIISVLREVGAYSKAFAYLVESCVQLVLARNRAFDILKSQDLLIQETSREGEARLKPHPICNAYLEISKELRQVLGELKMTIGKSSLSEGDAMDQLNDKLMELVRQG